MGGVQTAPRAGYKWGFSGICGEVGDPFPPV